MQGVKFSRLLIFFKWTPNGHSKELLRSLFSEQGVGKVVEVER